MELKEELMASIVVITYNQKHLLPITLDSLIKQKTTFPFEIVVGEDCSTDGTREVLAEYAQRYPELIRPIYNENNKGILGNYLSTLSHCTGKYIGVCAGDDFWNDEEKLQQQVDIMEQKPDVGLVYTDAIFESVSTNQRYERKTMELEDNVFTQLLKGCFLSAPTVCYRADLLRYVDPDELLEQDFAMEDYPLWLTFSLYTNFYHLRRPTITYRIEREYINDVKAVSMHSCSFDEKSTRIRLYFLRKYPDKTSLTENDILDDHYKICYLAGLNMNDRKHTLKYASLTSKRTPYIKRLTFICKSPLLFWLYQSYRKVTGKQRSALQMYFGQ